MSLTEQQRHFMWLTDAYRLGTTDWKICSSAVWNLVGSTMPTELIESREENGVRYVRQTELGRIVNKYI